MKREFSIAWVVLVIYVLGIEFAAPFLRPDLDVLRLVAAGWFAVFEGWAIARKKAGDTLSEHVWLFYGERSARVPLVIGFCLYVLLAIIAIPASFEPTVFGVPAAPLALAAGVALWLVPHFLFMGRHG